MSKKISQKIVGYKVATEEQAQEAVAKETESNIIQMHEKVSRPEELAGSTYKIKTPLSDHALYMTCLLYTSPSPRDRSLSRMPSSA